MKQTQLGSLYCILGATAWGFSGTCGEALFRAYQLNPLWLTALRMCSAGLLLSLWLLFRHGRTVFLPFLSLSEMGLVLLFALGGLLFCQLAYLSAIQHSNSGTATVIQTLSIVLLAVYYCVQSRTRPTFPLVLSIFFAIAGVYLLASGGHPGTLHLTVAGLFWGLCSAVGAASYNLLSREPVRRHGALPVTALGMLFGGIAVAFAARLWQLPPGLDRRALGLLFVLVFVGTIVAFLLFLQGIQLVGPVKAGIYACMEPVTAALLSCFWLGSSFSLTDLVGFALILCTVFLLRE